jgi:hypothetical protein
MMKRTTNVKAPKVARTYQERGLKAWATRLSNLRAHGLVDAKGNPTEQEADRRRKQACRAWVTRKANLAAAEKAAAEAKAVAKAKRAARKLAKAKAAKAQTKAVVVVASRGRGRKLNGHAAHA